MNNVELITIATYIFLIYLILALIIERIVEILMAVYNYFELKFRWYEFWNAKAKKYQAKFDRYNAYQGKSASRSRQLLNWILWKVISERPYEGGKEVISAQLIRINYIRAGTRILAFVLALLLVTIEDIDFLQFIYGAFGKSAPATKIIYIFIQSKFVRILLTAAVISVGSEPLHQVITRVEKFAEKKTAPASGGVS